MADEGLRALAEKYRELIALRRDPSRDDARLRALAARFPGALRELDTRTMQALEARLTEVEAAMSGGEVPAWCAPSLRFHGWLRVALRLRAEGVSDLAAARAWALTYEPSESGDPAHGDLDDARLALLLDPPEGRVSRAAKRLVGGGEREIDVLVFGERERGRERE